MSWTVDYTKWCSCTVHLNIHIYLTCHFAYICRCVLVLAVTVKSNVEIPYSSTVDKSDSDMSKGFFTMDFLSEAVSKECTWVLILWSTPFTNYISQLGDRHCSAGHSDLSFLSCHIKHIRALKMDNATALEIPITQLRLISTVKHQKQGCW